MAGTLAFGENSYNTRHDNMLSTVIAFYEVLMEARKQSLTEKGSV